MNPHLDLGAEGDMIEVGENKRTKGFSGASDAVLSVRIEERLPAPDAFGADHHRHGGGAGGGDRLRGDFRRLQEVIREHVRAERCRSDRFRPDRAQPADGHYARGDWCEDPRTGRRRGGGGGTGRMVSFEDKNLYNVIVQGWAPDSFMFEEMRRKIVDPPELAEKDKQPADGATAGILPIC